MRRHAVFIIVLVSAFLQPCVSSAGGEPAEPTQLGQPRADLTAAEFAAFYEGKKLFTQKLPGVGPLYDAETCVDCHNIPTVGGSGDLAHAVIVGPEPGNQQGGDIQYYPMHALAGWKIPTPPLNATRLVAPPLYGLAAIERIPDETIRAACGTGHPHPAKLLGSQPVNVVARFGMKPFVGTLPDFVDSMLQSENSVTSPLDHSKDDDSFPDPEVDRKFVETIAAFIRGLRPPGRNGTDAAGEAAFGAFGCAVCHVPNMPPAEGVFSDFCLHRMGDALANGIFDRYAGGDEFRTKPLQGLRFRTLYLHDGRARTLEEAIAAHGGEALDAMNAYFNAPAEQRAALLRFLNTL